MKGFHRFSLSLLILLGLVCQLCFSQDIPEVEIVGESYTTVESAVSILQCRVASNLQITSVEWKKSAGGAITPITLSTDSSKYSGGTPDSPPLVITKTLLDDAGFYTCTATSGAGTGTSSPARLTVLSNTIPVRLGREKYTVTVTETVVLQCIVTTNTPITSVRWTRNALGTLATITSNTDPNKYSGSTSSTPSLTIKNALLEDAGDYNCIVNSRGETGESDQPATLTVVASIPVVKLSEDIYSIEYGEDVTLECTVIAVPMHTSVQWKRTEAGTETTIVVDGTNAYEGATVNNPDLTIKSTDMNDAGFYTCYAKNSIGTGNSQSSYLDVIGNKPTVQLLSNNYLVNVGGTVTLECVVSAKPASTSVSWQKTINGFTSHINTATSSKFSGSTVDTPSLTINNAASNDKGYYTCSATNSIGTSSSGVAYLNIGREPDVVVTSQNYNTVIGSAVTLDCTITANPDPTTIYWQKIAANGIGSRINMNSGQYSGSTVSEPSLTITNPTLLDTGNYRCFASNSIGTGESEDTHLNVVGRKPVVIVSSQNYNVNFGSSVTLECRVTANPVHNTVYWQKIGVNVIGSNIDMNSGKYSGSTVSQPSLIISNAAQSDEGNYRCFASNSVGTGESQNTYLSVIGRKPVVIVSSQNYNVNFGSSVTLECRVTANPVHNNVYWQKIGVNGIGSNIDMNSGKYSGSTVSQPSLIISNAAQSDEGNYRCFGSNSVGTGESQNIYLSIIGRKPVVIVSSQNYNVNFGSSVTLECRVTANPVHNTVYWQKIDANGIGSNIDMNSGKYSGSTVSQPSLIILNAAQSDEGNYRCFASNSVGTGESQNTYLSVIGREPVVIVSTQNYNVNFGSSVTLECRVTANPVHNNVYWQKIGANGIGSNIDMNSGKYSGSTVSQPSLIISNAAQSDEGNYRCFASNSVGTGESQNTYLSIIGRKPVVTVSSLNYNVNFGLSVTLECRVTANPVYNNVYWQKIGVNGIGSNIDMNSGKYSGSTVSRPSLIISNAAKSDEGNYRCVASNGVGTGESQNTYLSIIGRKPVVIVPSQNYNVNVRSSVTLECRVTANPVHNNVYWQKIGANGIGSNIDMNSGKYSGSTVSQPSLIISNAARSDEGNYRCFASNSVGTGESQNAYVSVTGRKPVVIVSTQNYNVKFGSSITLECRVTANPVHNTVYWQKIGVNGNGSNIDMNSGKYSGSTVSQPSLIISNAAQSDEGNYRCFASNSVGTGESQNTYLSIIGRKPIVTISTQNYNVNFGLSVTLECRVTANPAHNNVYWQKIDANGIGSNIDMNSGKYSGSTVSRPSLIISNAAQSDEGNYRCFASNSVGTGESQNTYLSMTGRKPVVTISTQNYNVNFGSSVTLECRVTADPVHNTVYWQKIGVNGIGSNIDMNSGKYSGSTVSQPSLIISNAAQSDEGNYRCFASNSVGTGESQNTYVSMTGRKPVVTISTQNYNVNFGSSVTLECRVTANPVHNNVSWQKIGVLNGIGSNIDMNSGKYSGSTVSQPSLIISNAAQSDEGNYRCFASNSVGTGESQNTYLSMTGRKPVVTISTQNYNVNFGSSVTLECRVTANPVHNNVYWQKIGVLNGIGSNIDMNSGKYSGSTVSQPSLIISNAAQSDEGNYRCFASNSVGTGESQNTYLSMTGNNPTVVASQNINAQVGSSVTLNCAVTANPVQTNVYWQRIDGNGIGTTVNTDVGKYSGSTVSQPSLMISNVALSDEGNYRCYATNSFGTGQSQNTNLRITGNIPIVTIEGNKYRIDLGSSVTLGCTVLATPAYTDVYWKRTVNNVSTKILLNSPKYTGSTVSTPSLTINDADEEDKGSYACYATNSVGTGQSSNILLEVVGSIPLVQILQTSYSVNYGESVTLICTVTGKPAHSDVHWEKTVNGQSTTVVIGNKYTGSTVSEPSLTFTNADGSDTGFYTCYATNSVGTGHSRWTYLGVVQNLPVVTVLSSTYAANVGESIALGCSVTGNPQPTSVSWRKIENNISSRINLGNAQKYSGSTLTSPSLTILNVDQTDKGFYICEGTNAVGTGQSSRTYLDVIGDVPAVRIIKQQYTVKYGDSVTLECTVTGTPTVISVYWQKVQRGQTTAVNINMNNNNKYSGSTVQKPSLTIVNADLDDGAKYTCFATNSIGTSRSQQTDLTVVGDAPSCIIQSSTYTTLSGNSVTLECTINSNPVISSVLWTKTVSGQTQNISPSTNSKYSGATVGSPSLVISNADSTDEGYYICTASNRIGTGRSQQALLTVLGVIPSILIPQTRYRVIVDNTVTLRCTITASPMHTTVKWAREVNNSPVDIVMDNNKYSGSTVTTPSLTINSADKSDAGYYTCKATNSIGTGSSRRTYLDVEGYIPAVNIGARSYSVNVESSVTLKCTVSAEPKQSNVYWKRIDSGIYTLIDTSDKTKFDGSSVDSPSLVILNATSSDEGNYICYATNSVGMGQSAQTFLDVVGDIPIVTVPQVVYTGNVGGGITLACIVRSTPVHSSVYWQRIKDGQITTITATSNPSKYSGSTVSSPSLTISNFALADVAKYRCVAENSGSTGQSDLINVEVLGNIPTVTASVVPSVTYGDVVVINCIVKADPKETSIVWQKVLNSVPTALAVTSNVKYTGSTVNTPSLTIANVDNSDEGHYICQATNVLGTGSSNQVILNVVGEPPRLTSVTPNKQVVYEGDTVSAVCQTTSNPVATFKWFKGDSSDVIADGHKLLIDKSSKTDDGTYRCHAKNVYGSSEASLTVEVQYKPNVTISTVSNTFTGVKGSSINIPCSYVTKPSATKVSWEKITDQGQILLTIDGQKYGGGRLQSPGLTIFNLDDTDAATYECVVANSVGTGRSEIVKITIESSVDISIDPTYIDIIVGSAVDASCTTKDTSTFSWYFKDKVITTGPRLQIASTVDTDDGMYTCVATNSKGILQATVDVNVKYAPVSTATEANFETSIGEPVTLTCSTRANPSATEWTWSKDGSVLQKHHSDFYLVDMDSLQDYGTYTCIAKNTIGDSSTIVFRVKTKSEVKVGTITSDSEFSAAQIAAIVVGILFAIAASVIILICCFIYGLCRRTEPEAKKPPIDSAFFHDQPYVATSQMERPYRAPSVREASIITAPLPRESRYTNEPVYLNDIGKLLPREYKYVNPEIHYLPAIEYAYDNDVEKREKVSVIEYAYDNNIGKRGKTPTIDHNKPGDVYYIADDHVTYSVLEKRPATQIVGDSYTDTVLP